MQSNGNQELPSEKLLIDDDSNELSLFHQNQNFLDSVIYLNLVKKRHSAWILIAAWIFLGMILLLAGLAFYNIANDFGKDSIIIKIFFYLIFFSFATPFIVILIRMTYLRFNRKDKGFRA